MLLAYWEKFEVAHEKLIASSAKVEASGFPRRLARVSNAERGITPCCTWIVLIGQLNVVLRLSNLLPEAQRANKLPLGAPHFGGKGEATVKSVKFHLKRKIADTLLTFEELTTLLAQIEAVLNSRPLEPLSEGADDVSALTPGHVLIGQALTALPEPSLDDLNIARLSRWQLVQQKVECFWKRWSTSYLQHL
ncbi:uncharacterized protein LOC107045776 [Diachasma alloeum]|uniref:uncharacterized protein LOC107045776 n=1 Tax=Diachasma alloeum TaxID=454923 RepID=UPI0007381301|nr:uncharacterized protein LOC107045776 [Diachasma alloeum]